MWVDRHHSLTTGAVTYLTFLLFILSLSDGFAFARVAKRSVYVEENSFEERSAPTTEDHVGHDNTSANLTDRSLNYKRGCMQSKPQNQGSNAVPFSWICDSVIPGVDQCKVKIQDKGNVGANRPTSLFYTGSPTGQAACRSWATCTLPADSWVLWSGICDMDWYFETTKSIQRPFGPQGQNLPSDQVNAKADPFPKNLSQAFAEMSRGIVYICVPQDQVPDDRSWGSTSAWGGWEYPALTRNADVTEIWRVDPNNADGELGKPRRVWQASDGHSPQVPRGIRGDSLPAGIPDVNIPASR